MWSLMKRLIWLHVISGGGSSGARTTVTGASPLALANALAKPIRSLIQYGKVTTSDGDTYCNNGKLVAMDDELPSDYERQIGFVFAAATYYLIQDFHLRGSDTVRFSFSADKACNVFGCYTTNSATDNYSLYASTSSGGKYLRYDGATYNSYIPSAQIGERIDAVITPTGTTGMPTDSVITPAEFEATADLCIGTTSTSASSSKLDGSIWGNFVVDGRLMLIPCKRLSDDSLGYYDLDSDLFYKPTGSAPTSLGVDTSHLTALSVVGAPEVLTVTGKNLFNSDTLIDGMAIAADGTISDSGFSCYTTLIPVTPGSTYTYSGVCGSTPAGGNNKRIHGYKDGVWQQQIKMQRIATGEPFAITFTVPSDINGIRVSAFNTDTNRQVELNSTATAYEPYASQTASVVNLFSNGIVHDEQNIIGGTITRRTAVSVSGGVITVSALAEPIVEHVTAQPLRTAEGSNTVSVTSAVAPVQLSATYTASE